ncbi:hypothetical protein SDC9_190260 [bioreactor metagenome]|uniref:Uncharacterized protein n=1 Tax=bioreactor metagenome TaxID=1076179 RepID=A0A645I5G3_9ZZZZ
MAEEWSQPIDTDFHGFFDEPLVALHLFSRSESNLEIKVPPFVFLYAVLDTYNALFGIRLKQYAFIEKSFPVSNGQFFSFPHTEYFNTVL